MLTQQASTSEYTVQHEQGTREAAYDLIRVFAAFSVIIVHVAATVSASNRALEGINWWAGVLYESLFRSGIPLFLMLTGALLLPRANGFRFIINRILRILLPFLFWSFIFLVAKSRIENISLEAYFQNILEGKAYHYWYVYFILTAYLILPFIKKLLSMKWLDAKLLFILICAVTLMSYFIPEGVGGIHLVVRYLIYLLYIIWGYTVTSKRNSDWLNNTVFGVILIFIGISTTVAGTYLAGMHTGTASNSFYESTGMHIFLKSVGVWILLKKISGYISFKNQKFFKDISKYTFAIFLMHTLVLEHLVIVRLGLNAFTLTPVLGILISAIITLLLSLLIAHFLNKLPFGKYTY